MRPLELETSHAVYVRLQALKEGRGKNRTITREELAGLLCDHARMCRLLEGEGYRVTIDPQDAARAYEKPKTLPAGGDLFNLEA